jgi:hypothetical protein
MSDELVKRARNLGPHDSIAYAENLAAELTDRIEALTAERERLALAICGGEDAPGYANAQTIETLERVAKQNQQSHGATINSLLVAEADNARLREALTGIKRAAAHRMQNDRMDLHSYYFHTADAALNTGKELSHE